MIGSRIGPYSIVSELGSGGMGTVCRAEVTGDAPGLESGCAVALMVIHGHLLSQPGFFQRLGVSGVPDARRGCSGMCSDGVPESKCGPECRKSCRRCWEVHDVQINLPRWCVYVAVSILLVLGAGLLL